MSKFKVLESSEQNYQKIELEELKRGNYAQAIEHIELCQRNLWKTTYISADSDLININLEDFFKVEIPKLEPDISSSSEAEIYKKKKSSSRSKKYEK